MLSIKSDTHKFSKIIDYFLFKKLSENPMTIPDLVIALKELNASTRQVSNSLSRLRNDKKVSISEPREKAVKYCVIDGSTIEEPEGLTELGTLYKNPIKSKKKKGIENDDDEKVKLQLGMTQVPIFRENKFGGKKGLTKISFITDENTIIDIRTTSEIEVIENENVLVIKLMKKK
jgi:hypothetical protein